MVETISSINKKKRAKQKKKYGEQKNLVLIISTFLKYFRKYDVWRVINKLILDLGVKK